MSTFKAVLLVAGILVATALVANAQRPAARPQARRPAVESLEARCEDSGARLRKKLGDDGQIIVRPPFVIAGDMTEAELQDWHDRTIRPALLAMANSYFDEAPSQPVTILLFPEKESYNANIKKLYGEDSISIYGYYKPQSRTLVMNIGTGGGTLVHELTHALIDFDFPQVPDWFNEGLASLHEQCRFRESETGPWVEGLTNWRLAGLQKTIRAKRLRSLKTMITADDFRGELEGTNYAQARYLCLYLQEKGLLAEFYERFRDTHKEDPFGLKTLEEVLQITSWKTFDQEYQKWVLGLTTDR